MKKSKILVSTALALCMGATAVIPAFAAENQKFTYTKIGDYNADNAVDISDVTALQLQLVGNEVITGAMLEHLDFNGDGGFNVNDVSEIQKKIVGIIMLPKKQNITIIIMVKKYPVKAYRMRLYTVNTTVLLQ